MWMERRHTASITVAMANFKADRASRETAMIGGSKGYLMLIQYYITT